MASKRKNMIILLLLIISLLVSPVSICSKDSFDFALDFYNNNDYYRAISEFKRFTFYYPDSDKLKNAFLYIIKSHYYVHQYNQSVDEIYEIKLPLDRLVGNMVKTFTITGNTAAISANASLFGWNENTIKIS